MWTILEEEEQDFSKGIYFLTLINQSAVYIRILTKSTKKHM